MAALSNGLTGWLIGRTRNVKYFVILGWTMVVFGLGLLQLLDSSSTVVAWVFINIPPGIGTGVVFVSPYTTSADHALTFPGSINAIHPSYR
jgi:hypothetical protein